MLKWLKDKKKRQKFIQAHSWERDEKLYQLTQQNWSLRKELMEAKAEIGHFFIVINNLEKELQEKVEHIEYLKNQQRRF